MYSDVLLQGLASQIASANDQRKREIFRELVSKVTIQTIDEGGKRRARVEVEMFNCSPFGHPRPEVVQRWKESGAEVITTGMGGTISISTDGHDLRVSTFVSGARAGN